MSPIIRSLIEFAIKYVVSEIVKNLREHIDIETHIKKR